MNTAFHCCLILGALAFVAVSSHAKDKVAETALNIVFIGDSITFGANLSDPATQAPPVICSQQIQSKLDGSHVYFSNQGHCGHTTVDFLPPASADFTEAEKAAHQLMTEHPGRLLFSILLGTNDSAVNGPNGAPVSPENYGKNLTTIIHRLLADFPDSEVIVQQPTWYSPNTHNAATYEKEGLARLQTYFPVIQSVVKSEASVHPGRVHLGDTKGFAYFERTYLKELTAEPGANGTFYLHPNVTGATTLAGFWADSILAGIQQPK